MTLLDIARFCCETTGDLSSEALDYAKRAIRLKYDTLCIAHDWRESKRIVDRVLDPNLAGVFFLPYDAEEVIFCSLSYDGASFIRLTYRERDWIERFAGQVVSVPGNTPWFYRGENLAWPNINPGRMTFTSTNRSSFAVHIEGRDQNDFPQSESFVLQGIVQPDNTVNPQSISTVNSYKYVTSLSKDVTAVPMLVADEVSPAVQMPGGMTELVFTQIVLVPSPRLNGNPVYVRVQTKLKADVLGNDQSVPRVSSVWDALVCFATGSMYRRLGQVSKAQEQEGEAMQHVKAAINEEKNQAEWRQQAVPTMYESGDYLSGGVRVTSSFPWG